MKNFTKHFVLLILIIAIWMPSYTQNDQVEKNYVQAQNTMTNVKQSAYELDGFEGRALQKLEDLAGYLEIMSNKEFDIKLRKHAMNMALKLFKEGEVNIKNSDTNLSKLNILELNAYLNSVLETGYAKIVVEIKNREYIENLSLSKSDAYSGKLLFEQTNTYYNNKDIQEKVTEKKEVDIILVKGDKAFGKRTMSVWNVYLGDIRIVE